jgi:hypothetical protein
MLSAIASLVSKTVWALVKLNAPDEKKRRFARLMNNVQTALGEIEGALISMSATLAQLTVPAEPLSVEVLQSALARDLKQFLRAVHGLSAPMSRRFGDPTMEVLGVFEPEVRNTLVHAWLSDGGFVEALHKLQIRKVGPMTIRLVDEKFDPDNGRFGFGHGRIGYYEVEGETRDYSLMKPRDVKELLSQVEDTRASVKAARALLQDYVRRTFKIEDLL